MTITYMNLADPAGHHAEQRTREINEKVSRKLLSRLYRFHGNNPPDEEAAAAVQSSGQEFQRELSAGAIRSWSKTEEATLRKYAHLGIPELRRRLPHRTTSAIRQRARRCRIAITRVITTPTNDWRRGRIPIPRNAHPLVRALVEEANRQRLLWQEVADKSGVTRQALSKWRHCVNPHFVGFLAAANALNLDVRLVRRDDAA